MKFIARHGEGVSVALNSGMTTRLQVTEIHVSSGILDGGHQEARCSTAKHFVPVSDR